MIRLWQKVKNTLELIRDILLILFETEKPDYRDRRPDRYTNQNDG